MRLFLRVLPMVAVPLLLPGQKLPDPAMKGGMPLMEALAKRQSVRSFSERELPQQVLSNLLWAAWGVNRPATGQRTAPSAHNRQPIDLYVLTPKGAFLYEAKTHSLAQVAEGDLRKLAGRQEFVYTAPVNLVFVEDTARSGNDAQAAVWSGVTAGAISQNVYLFCASEGLATVVRGWVDHEPLAKALQLKPTQRVILAQTVGYPK
ncbi:MAG: SagB/ThcOx family dehydrogenase [Bryobacteraceae bacterium]|nr:SagB/ThcOx family dehydrogenase [Bryobacteraceae bacterium]MCX7603266.1 SagB/ThcOx family dehydrogenase [Bryobacteraceae bacterium]